MSRPTDGRPSEPAGGTAWDQRLEQLRQVALTGATGGGWGLALLCRRGTAAWMLAFPSSEQLPGNESEQATCEQAERSCLSISLHEQLVGVLAGMILDTERGSPA